MSSETVTRFFGLLAVACQALVLAVVVLALVATISDGARSALRRVRAEVGPAGLWPAFAIAATATAGSLYLSEIAGFLPCRLCWIQRGFMYPLALVLGIAAVVGWQRIRWFAIPWAAGGAMVSTWHVLVERYPDLEGSTSCDPDNPCSLNWIPWNGYLTIPTMALSGFLAVIVLLALLPSTRRDAAADEDPEHLSTV